VPVQITRAGAADVERVAELAARTFPLACPPDSPPAEIEAFIAQHLNRDRFAEYIADAERIVLLADDGTGLSGYAMLVFGEPADPEVAAQLTLRPTAELSKLYVAPEHHGSGVAAALMAAAVQQAADRGAAAVWLGTNQQNLRAQRFYAKSGFARLGVKRFRLGDRWEDDFVFERVLAAEAVGNRSGAGANGSVVSGASPAGSVSADPAEPQAAAAAAAAAATQPASVYDAVLARRSYSKVTEEVPDTAEVERLLEAAATASDHAGLAPWRVIELRGPARERLGEALATAAQAAGVPADAAAGQLRKPLRAELLLAVVVSYRESAKVPRWEQEATAAGVAHLLTLLLDDAGWGAMWRSGPYTRSPEVAAVHRLGVDEALLGWVYVGGRPGGIRRERHAVVDLSERHTAL
jgi:diamine N-acetyltransferase